MVSIISVHRITWHKGAIPDGEVWIKLGGDKGGGTFKMCFQHLNVTSPNAPENTCVISIFEAPDSYANLRIGLKCHIDDIVDLESHTWRYICLLESTTSSISEYGALFDRGKRVRVFLCGDYEFLCRIYGLSGASGMITINYYN